MLNEEFAFGVNAAGGWSPGGDWGLWLNLDGEFTGEFVDHYQATLNAGYRLNQDFRLLGTLDYLSKTIEVESWDKNEMLNQYGAGISLDYTISESIGLAGFYQHYKTEGQEYGRISEYDYVDSDNWQHYGWLYGAVRGGDYDELGVDATYRLPGLNMDIGLGLSQIWRKYEEMLGYDSKNVETAAGRLSYDWRDILASGVNFRAGVSMEFADNDNLSWNVSLDRQVGPVSVALTYSEYSNDLATSDRRLYASVNLPIGSTASEIKEGDRGPRKPAFSGQWLTSPVTGMGQPTLKVSEQLERRVDETEVNLAELPENATINKNLMTISGLPALTGVNATYCKPDSATAAFSLGMGNTSVIVDLEKLPCPANVMVTYNQSDGLYTSISFNTKEGSVKINNIDACINMPKDELEAIYRQAKYTKDDPSKLSIRVSGYSTAFSGDVVTYEVITKSGSEAQTNQNNTSMVIVWQVSGGTVVFQDFDIIKVKAPEVQEGKLATITASATATYVSGEVQYISHGEQETVVKPKVSDDDDDTGDDTGDDSGKPESLPNFMKNKNLYVENAGENFKIGFTTDDSGKPNYFCYTKGSADMNSMMSSYTATRGSDGKVTVAMAISVPINGKDTDFEMDLHLDKDDVTLLSTSNVRVIPKGGSTTTYKVTGYIK